MQLLFLSLSSNNQYDRMSVYSWANCSPSSQLDPYIPPNDYQIVYASCN